MSMVFLILRLIILGAYDGEGYIFGKNHKIEMTTDKKSHLLGILIDKNALDADRDDAAMDLGEEF